jgi:hypothetical protein
VLCAVPAHQPAFAQGVRGAGGGGVRLTLSGAPVLFDERLHAQRPKSGSAARRRS